MTTTAMKVIENKNSDEVSGPLNRQAAALADIQRLHEDFQAAREEIAQLKADLHREEDRVALLIADREKSEAVLVAENDRLRFEGLLFRDKLVELSTAMTNIGLLTAPAQAIVATVAELMAKK